MKEKHFSTWRYLRFIAVFMLLYPISVLAAQGHISVKGQFSLKEAIQFIEKNSEYTFFYKDSDLRDNTKKNINCSGTIEEVLKKLFTDSGVNYIIKGNEVIFKVNKTEKVEQQQQQKKRVITGVVIDGDLKEPIIGASVWLKNSSSGAVTNLDGKYTITVEGIGGVLEFSYIGMKKQEIVIGDQSIINVTLSADTKKLDEVVVVGYGHQKKESVVGAISSLDVGELNIPGSNISNVLAGQLAGVVSMQASGEPGKNSASDFYIRGIASFKGNSTPLVLVDGIERELDLVDVDDIATFSILKDASASAVYGVRGANGVILITTKKGTEGKPRINVRAEMGFKTPTRMPEMANSVQWAEMYNEAKGLTGNGDGGYSAEQIQKYRDGSDPDLYPNVNWLDQMYRNLASSERITLNLSGGGDICKYYVSGGFYNEGSIFRNAGNVYDYNSSIHYTKFNFRANMDFSVTPTTTFNVNLANIYESSWGPGATTKDIWEYAFNTSPNAYPVQYSDGTISAPSSASGFNPWNLLVHSGYREQSWNSAQSLIGVTQKLDMITPGLTANIKFSWDASNNTLQVRSKTPPQFHATGRNDDGSLDYKTIYEGSNNLSYAAPVTESKITTYMEGSLNYTHLFAQKHRVGVLFLYNHKIYKLLTAENQKKSLPYKSQGLAGRLTYAYKDKYFAEFNMGYTGSENFARGHRFGFFPAYALGWMVSSEKWFEPLTKVVNDLKLKASYGKVGNDDIGAQRRWAYEPTINAVNGWKYGKTGNQTGAGYRVGEIENTNVSWEEATKVNAGIELRLFDKLKIQADYFYEERNGIFLARAGLPAIVGLTTTPYVNVGKAKVSGIDGTVEYQQQVG
ncbi:SusC/RagA family TonB-linked outer membrane protein, partial [Bacteroides congonensis]